jgi:hypothetical protein
MSVRFWPKADTHIQAIGHPLPISHLDAEERERLQTSKKFLADQHAPRITESASAPMN